MAQGRIKEIDFAKGVLITLMVMFHLVYIGDTYPCAKRIVYSFHIPAFLLFSGYLANTDKTIKAFTHAITWLVVPYSIMEVGYILAASFFNVREHIDDLTVSVFIGKLTMRPLGPYWYLHTLVLCSTANFISARFAKRFSPHSWLFLCAALLYMLSLANLISFANAAYYLLGAAVRHTGAAFSSVFKPSLASVFPMTLLCLSGDLYRANMESLALTYCVVCLLLQISALRRMPLIVYVGRNTLPILLFSPVFTFLSKSFLRPLLSVDGSGSLFCVTATAFTLCGSLFVAYAMDCAHVSRLFIGKDRLLNSYRC